MTLPLRGLIAIAVLVTGVGAGLALGGSREAAVVMLVPGIAAVLLALGLGDPSLQAQRAVAPAPAEDASAGSPAVQDVINALGDPILIVRQTRVVLANRSALNLLGKHIVTEDVRTVIRHPAATDRLQDVAGAREDKVELVGLGAREQRWEMRIRQIGEGLRLIHLMDQSGTYQTERIRVDFVANASHELRTPLASILGYIETLDDPNAGDDPEVRGRFLKIMFDEAQRMQRLVNDLISLSRIEAEKFRLPDSLVDLVELVEEVSIELAYSHGDRVEDIVLDLAHGVPPVAGDRAQLSQLMHNLAGNALKYGRIGTPVTISVRGGSQEVIVLKVADEGEGIAAEHLPRLTERFYRVDAGRSRAAGGTGLGLAIVKHIVERHRSRLDISSKLGIGTTVTVTFPPAPEPVSSKVHRTVTGLPASR